MQAFGVLAIGIMNTVANPVILCLHVGKNQVFKSRFKVEEKG